MLITPSFRPLKILFENTKAPQSSCIPHICYLFKQPKFEAKNFYHLCGFDGCDIYEVCPHVSNLQGPLILPDPAQVTPLRLLLGKFACRYYKQLLIIWLRVIFKIIEFQNKIIWDEYGTGHQIIILGLYIFLDQWPSRTIDQKFVMTYPTPLGTNSQSGY